MTIVNIHILSGLIIFSMMGNCLALYTLLLGRSRLGRRRSKTIFFNITLADILVTLFPMAGKLLIQWLDVDISLMNNLKVSMSGKYWRGSGWLGWSSVNYSSSCRPLPWPPPTTCWWPWQWTGTGPSPNLSLFLDLLAGALLDTFLGSLMRAFKGTQPWSDIFSYMMKFGPLYIVK